MIDGNTEFLAHIGYPTHTFKAPKIFNPYFDHIGVNAIVVPMACQAADFAALIDTLKQISNCRGALVTMPHKVAAKNLCQTVSAQAAIAGSCNAIKFGRQRETIGDIFDGLGFVRSLEQKGFQPQGKKALVVGNGGVGCAIAAALAQAGVGQLALHDLNPESTTELHQRLRKHFPNLLVTTGSNDPHGIDLVVNATPMGMNENDPMPFDTDRLSPACWVGEVVMRTKLTGLIQAARDQGCPTQIGVDMLFAQIPAYLDFFSYPSTNTQTLRKLSDHLIDLEPRSPD